MRGSYALQLTIERAEFLSQTFALLQPVLVEQYEIFSVDFFSIDNFTKTAAYVYSHVRGMAFEDNNKIIPVIIPVISDMRISASPSAITLKMNDDESLIEVIALRDITSGEEISVNLPMNNAGMLLG